MQAVQQAGPLIDSFDKVILKLSQDFVKLTASQQFKDFIAYAAQELPKVVGLFEDLGKVAVTLTTSLAPVGDAMLGIASALAKMATAFDSLPDPLKTAVVGGGLAAILTRGVGTGAAATGLGSRILGPTTGSRVATLAGAGLVAGGIGSPGVGGTIADVLGGGILGFRAAEAGGGLGGHRSRTDGGGPAGPDPGAVHPRSLPPEARASGRRSAVVSYRVSGRWQARASGQRLVWPWGSRRPSSSPAT